MKTQTWLDTEQGQILDNIKFLKIFFLKFRYANKKNSISNKSEIIRYLFYT